MVFFRNTKIQEQKDRNRKSITYRTQVQESYFIPTFPKNLPKLHCIGRGGGGCTHTLVKKMFPVTKFHFWFFGAGGGEGWYTIIFLLTLGLK